MWLTQSNQRQGSTSNLRVSHLRVLQYAMEAHLLGWSRKLRSALCPSLTARWWRAAAACHLRCTKNSSTSCVNTMSLSRELNEIINWECGALNCPAWFVGSQSYRVAPAESVRGTFCFMIPVVQQWCSTLNHRLTARPEKVFSRICLPEVFLKSSDELLGVNFKCNLHSVKTRPDLLKQFLGSLQMILCSWKIFSVCNDNLPSHLVLFVVTSWTWLFMFIALLCWGAAEWMHELTKNKQVSRHHGTLIEDNALIKIVVGDSTVFPSWKLFSGLRDVCNLR